jgi:hypothetical protein
MAVGVVEVLEVIEVEHRERDALVFGERLLEACLPRAPVGQTRQRIGARHVGQLAEHVGAFDHGGDLVRQQRDRGCTRADERNQVASGLPGGTGLPRVAGLLGGLRTATHGSPSAARRRSWTRFAQ